MKGFIKNWLLTLFLPKYHPRPEREDIDWETLENQLEYRIQNREIFIEAFRHRSHPSCSHPESKLSNERLEFLGDAVVNFYVAEFLFQHYPRVAEGELTKMRAALVSREFMAKKSKILKLGQYLALGEGEKRSGGRTKDSILTNTLEAVVGAIYLDGGFQNARSFIERVILVNYKKVLGSEGVNYKGDLLEYLQKRHMPPPRYETRKETGPDHKRVYTVEVRIAGGILGVGRGKSKKTAEQEAARAALAKINNQF